MQEELADRLIIASKQLELVTQDVRGARPLPEDMARIAAFLYDLGENARELATLALDAVDRAEPGHPVRAADTGGDVQVFLGHAGSLFEAAQTFSGEARQKLEAMGV